MAASTHFPVAVDRANVPAGFLDGTAKPQRRRRGNPRWANPTLLAAIPVQPSAWDRFLYRLGLANDAAAIQVLRTGEGAANQIRQWVRDNRLRFIPECVLEALDMKDEVDG